MLGKQVDVIVGLQWGDEGKGKIVDYLAHKYDIVCRFQGGPNAGHTLYLDGKKIVLHTVPSGIFRQNIINVVGNGVVLDPVSFVNELESLDKMNIPFRDRLKLSKKIHLILPTHRLLDIASEQSKGKEKIGSTLKGIGPTYMDKTGRNGLRLGDVDLTNFMQKYKALKEKHLMLLKQHEEVEFDLNLEEMKWFDAIQKVKMLEQINCEYFLHDAIQKGKKILAEGAQGSMLDIDFGTYPYVTSSNTVTAGVCSGLGIAPSAIGDVIGITKAYCTRVGSGAFPTEQDNKIGEQLRQQGNEFGSTTGRSRRCGWIDIPALKYTCMINGVTQLIMTKLDVMNNFENVYFCDSYEINGEISNHMPYSLEDVKPHFRKLKGWSSNLEGMKSFEELPLEAWLYITEVESALGLKFNMISIGPEREKLVAR